MRWRTIGLVVFLTCLLTQTIFLNTFAASNTEKPLLKIAVLSDVHIMASNKNWSKQAAKKFEQALIDIKTYAPDVVVINGDLTNGNPEDYQLFRQILHRHYKGLLYAVMGNHEYYRVHHDHDWTDEKAKGLFMSQFGLQKPYYDTYIHGFHFLFLSSEKYQETREKYPDAAFLSAEQIHWFEGKMKQPAALRFVFLHQPLDTIFDPYDNTIQVVQSQVLKQIAHDHKPTLWFSGHTHDSLRSHDQIVMNHGLLYFGGGSTFTIHKRSLFPLPGYIKGKQFFETDTLRDSESRLITIYKKYVVMDVRDHIHKKWLTKYRFSFYF